MTAPSSSVPGIAPERAYDPAAIAAYGEDTIGDVLRRIVAERGAGGEAPVVLVNGQRVRDLSDIADYPAEAVARLEILPRGSGVRFGGSSAQRVLSVTLQRRFASQIANLTGVAATEGDWSSGSAGGTVTRIQGMDRLNVRLAASRRDSLLESERGVLQPTPSVPYALRGNITPDPGSGGGEIDPALSALVGQPVAVAGAPLGATPALADFAATADRPNLTDLGAYRTLTPKSWAIDVGVEGAKQIGNITLSLNALLDASDSTGLFGLPFGVLRLPASNRFSPFSRDVGIAVYATPPLSHRIRATRAGLNAALNADLGSWRAQLTAAYDRSDARTDATVAALPPSGVTAVLSDVTRNPFAGSLADLVPRATNSSDSLTANTDLQLTLMGQVFELPAGPLHVTLGGGWSENRLRGESANFGAFDREASRRTEPRGSLSAEIPLARGGRRGALGDLSLSLGYSVSAPSDTGTSHQASYSLVWTPRPWLQVTAGRSEVTRPPALLLTGAPQAVASGVRYFDVLTGQTVDVAVLTGGNPDLLPERERVDQLGVTLSPLPAINLQVRAEYVAVTDRNALAGLPPTSVAVMAAFPDRFVRDASGQLTRVDFRPINLDRTRQDRVAWGFDFDAPLAGDTARLQGSFLHTVHLRNDIDIHRGLPTLDLLKGGALGLGGDGARQLVDFTLGLSRPGGGIELTGAWRSESLLQTGSASEGTLRFHPIGTLGLRAFVEIGALAPHVGWTKGTRITLSVENLTDARQRVTDASGATPLPYQGPYLDAIGRTVSVQLRKSF